MGNFILKDPFWLLALLLIPLVVWLRQRRRMPVLLVPFASCAFALLAAAAVFQHYFELYATPRQPQA